MDQELVVFRISDDLFGFDLDRVSEIVIADTMKRKPDLPEEVEGVISVEGGEIPVIDFRKKFGIYSKSYADENWIVILEIEGRELGILVDGVVKMCKIASEEVKPMRSRLHTCHTRFITGFGHVKGEKFCLVCPEKIAKTVEVFSGSKVGVM